MKKQQNVAPNFNIKKQLADTIIAHTSGRKGWGLSLEQLIVNSVDEGATEVLVEFGQLNGQKALLIHDNGKGFSYKGIISYMGYGNSAKSASDNTTAGKNGNGSKFGLGLGNLEKTCIHVQTLSRDPKVGFGNMMVNFNYLCNLPPMGKANWRDFSSLNLTWTNQSNFNKWMPRRNTGTTTILTGFNPDKFGGKTKDKATYLKENLAKFLVPRVAKVVKVKVKNKWEQIDPIIFDGEPIFASKKIGGRLDDISFELYAGGRNRGIKICGNSNEIIGFNELMSKFSSTERSQISPAIAGATGHVYLAGGNFYRLTDGSFSDDFFADGSSEAFLAEFAAYSKQFEAKAEDVKNQEQRIKHEKALDAISFANQAEFGTIKAPKRKGGTQTSSPSRGIYVGEINISPSSITMEKKSHFQLTIQNKGSKQLNMSLFEWDDSKSAVKIHGGVKKGDRVTLVSGDSVGTSTLILSHPNLKEVIELKVKVVSKKEAYIKGPRYLTPGKSIQFSLENWTRDVFWALEGGNGVITCLNSSVNPLQTIISVPKGVDGIEEITLVACKSDKRTVIASKGLKIVHPGGGAKLIKVGDDVFELEVGALSSTICARKPEWMTPGKFPVLVINPNAKLLAEGLINGTHGMLNAIITVVTGKKVEQGDLTSESALQLSEEFLTKMLRRLR